MLLTCTSVSFLSVTDSGWNTTDWLCGSGIGAISGLIGTYDIQTPTNLTTIQTSTLTISAPGPNPAQNTVHAHEVIPDPSAKFVVVPDLGADLLHVYSVSKDSHTYDALFLLALSFGMEHLSLRTKDVLSSTS